MKKHSTKKGRIPKSEGGGTEANLYRSEITSISGGALEPEDLMRDLLPDWSCYQGERTTGYPERFSFSASEPKTGSPSSKLAKKGKRGRTRRQIE